MQSKVSGRRSAITSLLAGILLVGSALGLRGDATQTWTQLTPSGGPPVARIIHTAVYSQATNRMIVFGGFFGDPDSGFCGPSCLNDVWVLANADGTGGAPSWTQLAPTGPPPSARGYSGAAYDAANNRMILFAGDPHIGFCGGAVNDTWVLSHADGTGGTPAWTQLSPTGTAPDLRQGPNTVYDPASNRMIVFGGNNNACQPFNDGGVWVLSNANGLSGTPAWAKLSPLGLGPAGRVASSTVYDAAYNRMIVFGGASAAGNNNDVWVLDHANGLGGTPAWTHLIPSGTPPPARSSHAGVYDPATNQMVVFGGSTGAAGLTNSSWALSNANGLGGTPSWTPLGPSGTPPLPRQLHSAVLNTATNRMIVYGGDSCVPGDCFNLGDAWVLAGAVPAVQTTLTLAPASGNYGGSVDLQATLTSPDGVISGATINFTIDGFNFGSAITDVNGVATRSGVSLAGRNAGTYPGVVHASFAGTPGFASSNASGDIIVSKANPSIVWGFPAPISYGTGLGAAQLNATASFNSSPLAGTFTYAPTAGTVLNAGINQILSTTFDPADALNFESVTTNTLITVNQSNTTTSLTSSANPSSGQPVTFTATVAAVAPGSGTPTGTVTFKDGGATIGTGTLDASGHATYTTSSLSVAGSPHSITAAYGGDANFTTSTSLTVFQTVQRVLVSIEVTPSTATIGTGGHQSYQAIGHFSDNTTQTLMSGGSGGAGGGSPMWQVDFGQVPNPGLNVDACTTPQFPPGFGGYNSQVFLADHSTNTIIPTVWSTSTPIVQINGTITAAAAGGQVNATLTCTTPGLSATGSITAAWDVSQSSYIGTFVDFAGHSGAVTIRGWSTKTLMPEPRFGHGAATVNVAGENVVFVAGGDVGLPSASALAAYHPATDTWTTGLANPHPRESPGVATLGGLVYLVGGREPGGVAGTRVEAYDPVADAWTARTSLNTARAAFALVAANGKLYAIGGEGGSTPGPKLASVESFDPLTNVWTPETDMPDARTGHAAGTLVVNGQTTIAVVGGVTPTGPTAITRLYDVANHTWTTGAPMQGARNGMAAGVVNNTLWLVGGSVNSVLTRNTEGYFPAGNGQPDGWAVVGPSPSGRSALAAAVADSVLFAFGGYQGGPATTVATTEALTTPPVGVLSTTQNNNQTTVFWSSTNPSVATIDQNGNASGVATGATTIVASTGTVTCQPDHCGSLTVTNTTPNVQIFGGPATTNESSFQNFNRSGSFADADPMQNWTATVNYGDGTGTQPLSLFNIQQGFTPTGQFNLNHTYTENGVFTVTVTVDDHAGGVGTATLQVTVNNVAPQVSAPFSTNVSLGSTSNFGCVSFSDVASDGPFSVTVDYGDGGGQQAVTPNIPGSCGGPGGPGGPIGNFNLNHAYSQTGTFAVVVRITDKDNGVATNTVTVTVNRAMPSMNLMASPSSTTTYGQNVTFTATVTTSLPGVVAPTGTVTFRVDGVDVASPSLANGQAVYSTSTLTAGTSHNIVATYNGDANFNSVFRSTSRFVGKISPTMNLVSSSNEPSFGQAVTFTATVADPGGNVPPTGAVTFTIDGNMVASADLVNGQASFTTSSLTLGNHNVAANYAGDTHFFSAFRSTNLSVRGCIGSVRGSILFNGAPFTGLMQFVVTNENHPFSTSTGGFYFPDVEEGSYHLHVEAPPGYSVTPSEIDFTVGCGQERALTFIVSVIDTTAPVFTAPPNVTIDATSTAGAAYVYTTPVASDAMDGTVLVTCNPPSGSLFPMGTTAVVCTATDHAGNAATHSFTVTVRTPEQITADLIAQVAAADFQQAGNLLGSVLKSINGGNTQTACGQLGAFINQVQAQSGKKLTAGQAAALIQSANDAKGSLGCQ